MAEDNQGVRLAVEGAVKAGHQDDKIPGAPAASAA
ncbi:hypothetical protein FHS48_003300 [Novispirillum itersonii]|uniref:Uncharacterized protein n=1 Tax=Novispirillum itersonii TaxID=189 RepID=A0A7W9ZI24_NOVIT|nr:hypothetical protein [Novispirillum itersonii]